MSVRLINFDDGFTGTVTPLSFSDDVFAVVDNADNTKQLKVEVSTISPSTTRTITMPDRNIDLDGDTVNDSKFAIGDNADLTKKAQFEVSGITTATTRTITIPDRDIDLDGDDVNDSKFRIVDNGDTTKKVAFETSGITTGTTRTITVGDGDYSLAKQNLAASVAPTTTDDVNSGYSIGSLWVDTVTDKSYICVDATASAASWNDVRGSEGATQALDNLQAVSINAALIPDTDITHDIGSTTTAWREIYAEKYTTKTDADLILEATGIGAIQIDSQIYSIIPTPLIPTGTTQTIDFDTGNVQFIDLDSATGDVTMTLTNVRTGANYMIKVTQGTVARNLIWPASVFWADGIAPTISTGNDDIDLITFFYDGTNFLGSYTQNYS